MFRFVLPFIFVSLCLVLASPQNASAQRLLVEPETGLQMEAAGRFRLLHQGEGVYMLRRGRMFRARFVIGKSPFDARRTAEDFVDFTSMRVSRFIEREDHVLVRGRNRQGPVAIRFRPLGGGLIEVATMTGRRNPDRQLNRSLARNANRRPPLFLRISPRQIRQLSDILASQQGGRVIPLPVQVPVQTLTGPGTSAVVPNLPGWNFQANDGIVSGGHPTQGIVNLGIPVANFVTADPAQAIFQLWPQFMASNGASIQVLGVRFIPNTGGWLGAGFNSGMFTVRFRFNGLDWDALFVSGVSTTNPLWYHSYVGVPVGSSPAIGNALMNTWATWDPSAAAQQRLQNALLTVLTTVIPGNPIDPTVFDRLHRDWTAYIRQ